MESMSDACWLQVPDLLATVKGLLKACSVVLSTAGLGPGTLTGEMEEMNGWNEERKDRHTDTYRNGELEIYQQQQPGTSFSLLDI